MLEAKQTIQAPPTPERTPETEQFSGKIVQNIGDVAMQASEISNKPTQPRQRISDEFILSRYALPLESGQILSPRKTPTMHRLSEIIAEFTEFKNT